MADPEHLALLAQGLKPWNVWRTEKPSIRPDLGAAKLIGANIGAANLSGANLSGANPQRGEPQRGKPLFGALG
jgi:hypothetical protein